ncbi:helicase-related protein [Aggregatilinea lenta]|uniref:helicase-related protein n=1 Tax=Aggregatilinea lenta TaxID=913108 RepID=UPI000E5B778F|nr:helicase-related protein [Aggregatilinea lenta]
MYHPPDYIDNTADERTLGTVLRCLLTEWDERELDIASGFFEPKVWEMLADALQQLEVFRLLLGRPPELEAPSADDGVVNLQWFYRERLRQDLEALPLDRHYAGMIDELTTFLAQELVQVRYYNGAFLHAKAYLTLNAAIVGSSNFTPSGMTRKAELNLVQQNQAVIRDLRQNWFERMWEYSSDHKQDLIDALNESKFGDAPWTPHDVFIKVLYEYFRDRIIPEDIEARIGVELASFQQEGLREAIRLIDRHGGVIVSDAVGLGKTYIGMSLLEHYVLGKRRKGFIPRGLVVCPAQLRDLVWEPKLDEYGIKAEVISQELISRDTFDWKHYNGYDVVLIDESHNFRNANTNRYQNLMKMLATGNPETKVILMTATPVNNSVWDLYHQVSFLTRGQDTYFREYGIRNLKGFFREVQDGGADIFTVLEQTMVRRSRQDVRERQRAGEEIRLPGKGIIHFPERMLHSVNYDLEATYDGFYDRIATRIDSLSLISFNIEQYRKGEVDQEIERVRQYSNALIGILKTLYLKRLESSLAAFEVSIRRQQQFQERFYDLLANHGRLLDSRSNRRLLALEALEDDTATEDIQAIIDSLPEADITEYDLRALRRELRQDMSTLDAILDDVALVQRLDDERKRDAKLAEVKRLLAGDLCNQKILIFSYYRDTAQYLYDSVVSDPAWQDLWSKPPTIEVIHGNTDAHKREDLVKRFAPKANTTEDNPSPTSEVKPEIDILISTDVLSEGQNLQDAGIIINYDLHWTPIRMIQRAGRIDRLGTDFETLHVFNCFPQTGLEKLLGLVERLQDRIRDIDRTVGLDASILGEIVSKRSLDQLRKLRDEDQSVIDQLEQDSELVSTDEMKLPLILYLQQAGLEKIRSIPLGIGSGIAKSPRPSGVLFAFQAGDRHFWRLYTTDEVISDKRRLFRYLLVDPTEPRSMPSGFEVYDLLDQATNDVLKEINSALRTQRIKPKMSAINMELDAALRQPTLLTTTNVASADELVAPEELRQKVQQVIQNISLDAFKRDKTLKTLRTQYRDDQNQRALVEGLDEFFIENELYRDVIAPKTTLEQVRTEDLRLVAYEVFE